MKKYLWLGLAGVSVLLSVGLGACSSSKEGAEARRRAPAPTVTEPDVNLGLAPAISEVKTVQLYLDPDERQLPVLSLGDRGQQLNLEFDLLSDRGRPLSVYFYHADREWQRDLTPVEYLSSFQRDDILNFSPSHATDVNYVHYTYSFPNQTIGFTVSGNYIVRVTEQGEENNILFERPFFVAEQSVGATMALDNVMVTGRGFPATVPLIQFTPPGDLMGNTFDYSVCFVRNGRYDRARCSSDPRLGVQPGMQFYLEPEEAFQAEAPEYFLDLSSLFAGGEIELADVSTVPNTVTLEPDYAQFPGSLTAPVLNGQTVVSAAVDDLLEADLSADYAEVGFSFVPPDEQPLSSDIVVTGSFNDWEIDPAHTLEWVPERGRYEGSVLLKQGWYEYRYASPDRRMQRILETAPPRAENVYMAFIYYSDLRLSTDRLLGVEGVMAR